jgi:adenylate cyclase
MALENMDLNRRWSEGVALTDQMDKILHRYLSGSVADEVLKRVHQAQNWAGERRYVTVLIADLRGFTSVSETNTPEEIVHCLNEYFSEIIEIVLSHGGSVDKFMGDAVLVVFGAPTPLAESEVSAVSCALEMQNSLKRLNEKRAAKGLFTLEMGIGICAGDVVAGNIGSDKRMDFTVIGDPVNMASKLQSLAGPGEIYITASLAGNDKLKDVFKFSPAKMVRIKGKNEMIAVSNVTEYLPKFEESEKWSMGDVRT